MFRVIRVILLSSVLLFVGLAALQLKVDLADWTNTKWVVIYPINFDGSQAAAKYIEKLGDDDFARVEDFLNEQARRFGLPNETPFRVRMGSVVDTIPPEAPQDRHWLRSVWWSLKLRHWAADFKTENTGSPADVRVFVEYHDPKVFERLPHSLGMSKLSLAVVKAYASRHMRGSNQIVIAHELMHVFGATDKYDLNTNLPIFPDGYADPRRQPRYPQTKAELMGGRIPLSASQANEAKSLRDVVIGDKTAREVNWTQ